MRLVQPGTGSPSARTTCRKWAFTFSCCLIFRVAPLLGQQAGGVPAAGPKVRMVRAVAGTKGESRGGSYVILDPRTTFYVPDDLQGIGYFEWEAPKGTHDWEGNCKGPNEWLAV